MDWYWIGLIVANIPIYVLVGWLIFDTKEVAADNFFEAVVAMIWSTFIGAFSSTLTRNDGVWTVAIFLIICAAFVYGEHFALQRYWFTN